MMRMLDMKAGSAGALDRLSRVIHHYPPPANTVPIQGDRREIIRSPYRMGKHVGRDGFLAHL
jgi:hypothetical protein